ncbi:hypothetical protein VKT23_001446 [Stygiomarasmius scandens]|uniref:Carrier domain-containing protein n=1 Tax=Marasmiellus scandens TaxID=2682957 RepID=A0ABR1K574_9AGAR
MSVDSIHPPFPVTFRFTPSPTFRPPPFDGSLTVPEIVDWHYKHSAKNPLFVYPRADGSLCKITWAEFACAVATGARIIRSRVCKVAADGAVIDVIPYWTTKLSIVRSNFIGFPISSRNSPEAIAHLIDEVGVTHLLVGHDASMKDLTDAAFQILQKEYNYDSTESNKRIPSTSPMLTFEELYLDHGNNADQYLQKVREEIPLTRKRPDDIQLILHSSGSTSFPKPIPWNTRSIIQTSIGPWLGERNMMGKIISINVCPMFHVMGMFQMVWSLTSGMTYGTFEPKLPPVQPTPEHAFEGAVAVNADYVLSVPSMIEVWSRQPSYVDWMATRDGIIFGGGPLDTGVGNELSNKGISLITVYGSTESGVVTLSMPEKVDVDSWEYFRFSRSLKTHLVPVFDNEYELVIVASEHFTPRAINTKVDGVDAYATSDLLVEHPRKKGYWKIVGRADSQIIHSSGEKTNPEPLESIMDQNPLIQCCVVFGHGKFQAGILVEPKKENQFDPKDLQKLSEFRNQIWPTVEKLNTFAPQHSRIFKEMILVTSPSKPFTYTAKNTPRRNAILKDYASEIEEIYSNMEESTQSNIAAPTNWDVTASTGFVRAIVQKVLSNHDIKDDDDLFQHGGDSLQATWIRNSLLRALRDSAKIDTRGSSSNFIYDYPTISALGTFVSAVAQNGSFDIGDGSLEKVVASMLQMVGKYSQNFPEPKNPPGVKQPMPNNKKTVLMTGSTGGFGVHVLDRLIEDPAVDKVYALVRKGDLGIKTKQRSACVERGVDTGLVESAKVVLLEASLTEERFRLADKIFDEIKGSVTHIIANAWRVDFNIGLTSFESDIKGFRQMLDLALSTNSLLVFISSISVFQNFTYAKKLPFVEESLPAEVASTGGYPQSKWVCEQIMQTAASVGLRSVVVRLGQSCGSPNGSWNSKEWLPALVRSAPILGCVADNDKPISLIPADMAASALRDFLDAPTTEQNPTFVHLIHPKPVKWSSLARIIASRLKVDVLPYSQWLERLEDAGKAVENAEQKISALRILPFYKGVLQCLDAPNCEAFGIVEIETKQAVRLSKTLADPGLAQLGEEDVNRWLSYWRLL